MTEEAEDCELVPRVGIERLSPAAIMPVMCSEHPVTYELYCAYSTTIPPHDRKPLLTDIRLFVPENCYGVLEPRSLLDPKFFFDVGKGCVEHGCRESVTVTFFNLSDAAFTFRRGDMICRLTVFRKIVLPARKALLYEVVR
uniref:dUTP diphosphatase n=1 Tax=Psittacine aviadenovirus B TaxID=2169709 RepID=A0AB38ZP98_9ADEN